MVEHLDRARHRLDERFVNIPKGAALMPPHQGWLRAIREALGMTRAQMAKRMGIKPQSVESLESSELHGSVQLNSLRKAAQAMNCKLVYAIIPNRPLQEMVETRELSLLLRDIGRINQTMALENQAVGDSLKSPRTSIPARILWNEI